MSNQVLSLVPYCNKTLWICLAILEQFFLSVFIPFFTDASKIWVQLPFSNSINLPIPNLKWSFFKMMNGLTRQETWWDLPISHPFRLSLDLIAHYLSFLSRQTSLKFLLIDSSHENLHLDFKMCPNMASINFPKTRGNSSLIILDYVKLLAF